MGEYVLHQGQLLPAAQKTAVQSVKPQGQGLKVRVNFCHLLGKIQVGIACKFTRMRGQQRRGQHGNMQPRRRKNRQRYGKGTAAHTTQVMNGEHLLLQGNTSRQMVEVKERFLS